MTINERLELIKLDIIFKDKVSSVNMEQLEDIIILLELGKNGYYNYKRDYETKEK